MSLTSEAFLHLDYLRVYLKPFVRLHWFRSTYCCDLVWEQAFILFIAYIHHCTDLRCHGRPCI